MPLMFTNIMVPIFPDLNWLAVALYELVLSLVCFLAINHINEKKQDRFSRRRAKKQKAIKNVPFMACLFVFVGFIVGIFKYMPVAVMSNSMASIINRGDIVVIEKLNKQEVKQLKKYDIIEYNLDNSIIIHRIIEVEELSNGEVRFITKGDNNNVRDKDPVSEKQVIGKVKFKISYIGYPVVYLNDFFENTKPNVEMGK